MPPKRTRTEAATPNFKNSDQERRYSQLAKRNITAPRNYDEATVAALGLSEEIMWLVQQNHWTQFVTQHYPVYRRITLEFLSSINVEVLSGNNCVEGLISFRLYDRDYTLNLAEFNSIYGFRSGGERRLPRDFNENEFWHAISDGSGSYQASSAKASFIFNPCLRYLHRFMTNSIFGRGDSMGNIRQSELGFLWAMLNNYNLDYGSFLARHLEKVGKADRGHIVVGGLITPIARHVGLNLRLAPTISSDLRLDLVYLQTFMLTQVSGTYYLRTKFSDRHFALPNPQLTALRGRHAWNATSYGVNRPPPEEDAPSPPPHHPPPSTPGPSSSSAPSDPYLQYFHDLQATIEREGHETRAAVQSLQHELQQQNEMLQQMYQWHLSQGHFPPPPQ